MSEPLRLRPLPLTRERFAPYGDVIDTQVSGQKPMNDARFERFDDLARVDAGEGGRVAVSISRCRAATTLPYRIDMVERHPLGSQAFVPLGRARMIVVVAEPSAGVESADLRAFVTNGRQGINYRPGTWHMPLIAFEPGQEFLIIDRAADRPNCDTHQLDQPVLLIEP